MLQLLIPFSIEEKVFVARTDVAETFEEVLQIALDVYNFSNQTEQVAEMPAPQPQEEGENESNDVEETEQQPEEQKQEPQQMPQGQQPQDDFEEGKNLRKK